MGLKTFSPFLVLLISFVVPGQTPPTTKTKQATNATGHYRLRKEEFRNRINVQQLPGARVKFDLLALWVSHYNPENVHHGTLQGIANLENGVATYEAGGCKLRLEFLLNKVRITQSDEAGDCGFGANVTATGTYRKIDNKKPKFDFQGLEAYSLTFRNQSIQKLFVRFLAKRGAPARGSN